MFVTVIDAIAIAAVCVIALMLYIPQVRVRHLLDNEDEVIDDLADIERREEAHRAAAATDANRNGKGEFAPLGEVLGPRLGEFQRIEGTDIWSRGGYYFTVLLPDREYHQVSATSPDVFPGYAEVAELIVAWPANPGRTGMRAYARWPDGILLQHAIDGFPYTLESPFPRVELVRVDAKGPSPADRYDGEDWRPPVFSAAQRPGK